MHDGTEAIRWQHEQRARAELEASIRRDIAEEIDALKDQVRNLEFELDRRPNAIEAADLRSEVRDLKASLAQARYLQNSAEQSREELLGKLAAKAGGSGGSVRPGKPVNRVVFWVTAHLNQPAQPMLDLLWQVRPKFGDEPEQGIKVAAGTADGNVLKLVIDYTVKGGVPQDIERMLDKTAARMSKFLRDELVVLDVHCDEQSRVILDKPPNDDLAEAED